MPTDSREDERFLALFEASPLASVLYRLDGTVERWNAAAEVLFGWRADEAVGRRLPDVPPHVSPEHIRLADAVTRGETSSPAAGTWLHRDGRLVVAVATSVKVLDEEGLVAGAVVMFERDSAAARFEALVEHSSDVVVVYGPDRRCSYVSPSAERVFGWRPDQLLGTDPRELVPADELDRLLGSPTSAPNGPGTTTLLTHRIPHSDGSHRWVETAVTNSLDDPAVGGIVLNVRDVTTRVEAEKRLADLALHDPLTRLANRTLLLDRLGHALARAQRSGVPLGVLFVDLDRFKEVNDTYGHAVGDDLLVAVGNRLRGSLRETETIARYGGDEFVVVSEGVADETAVQAVADRVRAALAKPFTIQGRPYSVGASVGVAVAYPEASGGPELVIQQADLAMYRAKGRG